MPTDANGICRAVPISSAARLITGFGRTQMINESVAKKLLANVDAGLALSAELATNVLIEMKSPGCAYLSLTERGSHE